MKINIFKYLIYLFPAILACSVNVADHGGGSEVGNGIVTGTIFNKNGTPAPGTQVTLLPADYNPLNDSAVQDFPRDTTDESGTYSFTIKSNSIPEFSLEAVHLTQRTRTHIASIKVPQDTTFIKYVPQVIIKEVGKVTFYLPDTTNIKNAYMYVKGTTLKSSLAGAVPYNEECLTITVDSLPETVFSGAYYKSGGLFREEMVFADTFEVFATETTHVNAFVYWAHYRRDNSDIPMASIYDVFVASNDNIWVATGSEGVVVYNGTAWNVFNESNSLLPNNAVNHVTGDRAGNIWFATYNGAAVYNGSTWYVYNTASSQLPTDLINQIESDSSGKLWFATEEGAASFDGSSWRYYSPDNSGLPSEGVKSLAVDSDGSIWFATDKGLARFYNNSWTVFNSQNSDLIADYTFWITTDSKGNKWVGYFWESGLSKFDGTDWTYYFMNHSYMLDGIVEQVVEDRLGNIWVVTNLGLTRFNGRTWCDFRGKRFNQLDKQHFISIAVDKDNNKWLGTWAGSIINHGIISFGPTKK